MANGTPPSGITKLKDYSGYLALRLVIATIQSLPLSACEVAAKGFAWLAGDVLRFRRKVLIENLTIAFPDRPEEYQDLIRRTWQHLFLLVAEIAHTSRKVHRTNWRERCQIPDVETIVRNLLTDRPKVIISGHHGNFEIGGYLLGMFGFPTHTVARTIDNPYVDRFVNEFRGRTGQHMLPKQGSRDAIEAVLAGGGVLALLGDQAAGQKACWVNFFGRPASTHKAVSLFTLGYEAPTMVIATLRTHEPLTYQVDVADAVDPTDESFPYGDTTSLTQWFTDCLERLILVAPDQYWWVHRRWKGEPSARVRKQLEAMPRTTATKTTMAESPR